MILLMEGKETTNSMARWAKTTSREVKEMILFTAATVMMSSMVALVTIKSTEDGEQTL